MWWPHAYSFGSFKTCSGLEPVPRGEPHISPSPLAGDLATVPSQAIGRKEMFYLTMHSTHFIYGYMASDIW